MNNTENMTKMFAFADEMMKKYWDMLLVGMGSISWTQEQAENMVRKYMDQNKTAREENMKLMEQVLEQVKKNQMEIQKMVQEAVKISFENANWENINVFSEMNKKIDELAKKVENL